jgi:glycosyltransferase involved in cell wall biosynthesis
VVGTLVRGGAEKQCIYTVRALLERGVDVRVYTLTTGEALEPGMIRLGAPCVWVGRRAWPPARLAALGAALFGFAPHVVQASHFYTNLYVAMAARGCGALGIGALRNDVIHEMEANGRWGRHLLRSPAALVANSEAARRTAVRFGIPPRRIRVVPNAIDLGESPTPVRAKAAEDGVVAVLVARLVAMKRAERFLEALALARREVPTLTGTIVGDGPERPRLEEVARSLGLLPDGVAFLGERDSAPVIAGSDLLVATSDHEGFPNVILEAMAASLPVVSTPAGDAARVIEDGSTGWVVPFDDRDRLVERIVALARDPALRHRMGAAGRARAERLYGFDRLGAAWLEAYRGFGSELGYRRIAARLGGSSPDGSTRNGVGTELPAPTPRDALG